MAGVWTALTASFCLVFEVSHKLPGWSLDAAYKGLFYQTDHTAKALFGHAYAIMQMHYTAHAILICNTRYAIRHMQHSVCNTALGVFSGCSVWSQALPRCHLFIESPICRKDISINAFLCRQTWFCGHRDPGGGTFGFCKDKRRLKNLLKSGQFWNLVPGLL